MNANFAFSTIWMLFFVTVSAIGCSSNSRNSNSGNNGVPDMNASLPGGYSPGSTNSSETVAAAEFAVEEQSKTGPALVLSSIEYAKTQVVSGTNFELELMVLDGKVKRSARATVYTDLSQKRSLSAWVWK